ncbi:hypothetical protein Efla_006925 [Eimeria flavescens]
MERLLEGYALEDLGTSSSPVVEEQDQQFEEERKAPQSSHEAEPPQAEASSPEGAGRTAETSSSNLLAEVPTQSAIDLAAASATDSEPDPAVQGDEAALEIKAGGSGDAGKSVKLSLRTYDAIGEAVAPTTATPQGKMNIAATERIHNSYALELLSDMPPPSILPRQLRTKRSIGVLKRATSCRPPRDQSPPEGSHAADAANNPSDGEPQAGGEGGKAEGDASSTASSSTNPRASATSDHEFLLFMKEIEELDSKREVESASSQSAETAVTPQQPQPQGEQSFSSCESQPVHSRPSEASQPPVQQSLSSRESQPVHHGSSEAAQPQQSFWQAVVDSASHRTYYWNVATDEVTWDLPREFTAIKSLNNWSSGVEQNDSNKWAASTFRLTQELPTCAEKIQQLILQLDFMEDELDAMYENPASAEAAPSAEEANISARLQRFRSLKKKREQQRQKQLQETKGACADDELLKELIDLQLQQDQQYAPWQCPRCKRCNAEPRTHPQHTEIRSLASSLARRLGSVEKEWAAAMLAALKARLEDWIDGGLNSSFFLERLQKMQQEFQKHLSQEAEADDRQQELASVFPYSAAAASASVAVKTPRNCLASAVATAPPAKAGGARLPAGSKSVAAMPKGSSTHGGEQLTAVCSPPTPSGPPPTPPDEAPPAAPPGAADAAQAEAATAAAGALPSPLEASSRQRRLAASAADEAVRFARPAEVLTKLAAHSYHCRSRRHVASRRRGATVPQALGVFRQVYDAVQNGDANVTTSREGAQASVSTSANAKRSMSSSGSIKVTSSNPLVRKRMQLVERWQKSRQMDEESEEEDYEQRKERQKQRKIDEWKEREMASRRGLNNANFIEVTADWRSLVEKK